jgi:hypothetical protein
VIEEAERCSMTDIAGPEIRDQGLRVENPYRVELTGPLKTLAWPTVCPRCGSPAAERIRVEKVFERVALRRIRSPDDPTKYAIARVDVPFCAACASEHRKLVRGLSPWQRVTSYMASLFVIPLVGSLMGIALFFHPLAVGSGEATVLIRPTPPQLWFFALLVPWSAAMLWLVTRRLRVPAPTRVATAFDFSDDLAGIFSRQRRRYAILDQTFFDAFRAANAHRAVSD